MRAKKQAVIKEARVEIERDITLVQVRCRRCNTVLVRHSLDVSLQAPLAQKALGTVIKKPKASIKSITKKQLREVLFARVALRCQPLNVARHGRACYRHGRGRQRVVVKTANENRLLRRFFGPLLPFEMLCWSVGR